MSYVYQRYLDKGDPTYYGRYTEPGTKKRRLRNLGTPNKQQAENILRKMLRALEEGRFAEVEATKKRRDISRLGALFRVYHTAAFIKTRSKENNICSLRSLIRHGMESLAGAADTEIDALPATLLTGKLMRAMQVNILAAAGDDNLKKDSAAITANSIRRQARSLFTKDLVHIAGVYHDLALPDLDSFLSIPPLPEPPKDFKMPAPELITKIREAAEQLRTADPNLYRIYVLSLGSGLRKSEITFARWTWIEQTAPDRYHVHIQTNEEFRPKGKRDRVVPLEAAAYRALAELRIPKLDTVAADYILDGHKTERSDAAFDRFSAWMKAQGWTRKKKAHELRKLFGSYVNQQAGLSAAQDLLGHSSIKTTKDYYVGAIDLPQIKIFGA